MNVYNPHAPVDAALPKPEHAQHDQDIIIISNLCLIGQHGLFSEEKTLGQRFYVDIECYLDLHPAAATDAYEETVCYDALRKTAEAVSNAASYNLIETLAEGIALAVLEQFSKVTKVRVAVRKPNAPIAAVFDYVGVQVVRSRALK